jgi:hypothetical protein
MGWVAATATSTVGFHFLFRAEHKRQRAFDRMVSRAHDRIERELNPPEPPSQEDYRRMMDMQNAARAMANAFGQASAHPLQAQYMNQAQQRLQLLGRGGGMFGVRGLFGL